MELSCTSVMLPRWELDETFDKLHEYRLRRRRAALPLQPR